MFRKLLATAVALVLAAGMTALSAGQASAVSPNVTITATTASNGTTTLTYRATATSAGTVRHILLSIPAGSSGRITSINGTVSTVAPNVLKWTPSRTVTVAVGARFALPLYGLKLPSGGPWTLGFNATSTTGTKISYGTGVLAPLVTKVYAPNIGITATNPIPGETTNLTYTGVITQSGVISRIVMQLPTGTTGAMTTINGTLSVANGYATWTPRAPITVAAGARLGIPLYGAALSRYGGVMTLAMSARTSTGGTLMSGTGTLALIAPPAKMPSVAATAFAPVAPGCPTTWPTTAAENAKAGTGDWVIPASMDGGLAAYLTEVSAACGDSVTLKVTSGKPVDVVAYRMGYYAGLGGREVWRADNVPTVVQPDPTVDGTDSAGNPLLMVSAKDWSPTLTIHVDDAWVPGTYLLKVSDGTEAAYAPLTVRDDTGTKHDLLIQQATTTWAAYNKWGGYSFYTTPGSGRLSFDRPYQEGQGSGQFLPLEQGLVFWAESKGLDVTYWTNNDLDELGGQLPARAGTLFLPAHDEYYSPTMRAALSQAIERGVNVANLGANTVYRKIGFTDPSRREWDIDRFTAGYTSTTWRYLGDAYASQPLLGAEYVCALYGNTLTTGTSWLFSGITPGTAIPGFIAGEIDLVDRNLYQQPGLAKVATGTGVCRTSSRSVPMEATTYTAASGARVLNGSSFAYGCFLVGRCPTNWTVPTPSDASRRTVGIMLANITEWVSRGTISVPSETTTAKMAVTVPKNSVEMSNQP
jgi:hypothetical protein